ncbi:MAG: acyl-CoA thioesterase [Ignavibacteriae bacterium]|nr:acyl-CoA thioesterase [Ignavibacteriota bacterium]
MKTYKKELFRVEKDINIKTYDIDFAGHVNNVVYIRWLEDMRLLWLEKFLPLEELTENKLFPVIRSTHIEYKRQLKMFDKVKAVTYLSKMERELIWTLRTEFLVDNKFSAIAEQKGVAFNLETNKMVGLPAAMINLDK